MLYDKFIENVGEFDSCKIDIIEDTYFPARRFRLTDNLGNENYSENLFDVIYQSSIDQDEKKNLDKIFLDKFHSIDKDRVEITQEEPAKKNINNYPRFLFSPNDRNNKGAFIMHLETPKVIYKVHYAVNRSTGTLDLEPLNFFDNCTDEEAEKVLIDTKNYLFDQILSRKIKI